MRHAITTMLAILSLTGIAGCDSQAQQRSWWVTRDGVLLNSAAHPKTLIDLPGWLWAQEPLCPPDVAVGPDGEAVITSNVVPMLWSIEPRTLAVTVHDVQLDADEGKDVGFVAIVYSPAHGAFFAYSESPPAVWKIDRQLGQATKMPGSDPSRTRSPRSASLRGPCAELAARLARFAGMAN